RRALAHVRASKPPRSGQRLNFDGGMSANVLGRAGELYDLEFDMEEPLAEVLERIGHIPLPPYIDRADEPADRERYQTIYARASGRRIVAVGTTVVRALESAAQDGELRPLDGETDIFIYPGYRFQSVDALLTNFHLPESSLLMLVCAFSGSERVLEAYRHAV